MKRFVGKLLNRMSTDLLHRPVAAQQIEVIPYGRWGWVMRQLPVALVIIITSTLLTIYGAASYLFTRQLSGIGIALAGLVLFWLRVPFERAIQRSFSLSPALRISPQRFFAVFTDPGEFRVDLRMRGGRGSWAILALLADAAIMVSALVINWVRPNAFMGQGLLACLGIAMLGVVAAAALVFGIIGVRRLYWRIRLFLRRHTNELEVEVKRLGHSLEGMQVALRDQAEKNLAVLLDLEHRLFEARSQGIQATRQIREELTLWLLERLPADHPARRYLEARRPVAQTTPQSSAATRPS